MTPSTGQTEGEQGGDRANSSHDVKLLGHTTETY